MRETEKREFVCDSANAVSLLGFLRGATRKKKKRQYFYLRPMLLSTSGGDIGHGWEFRSHIKSEQGGHAKLSWEGGQVLHSCHQHLVAEQRASTSTAIYKGGCSHRAVQKKKEYYSI